MAAATSPNDQLFAQIMETVSGDLKELEFLDQAIDYVRRNSTFLVKPTSGTKIKKLVNKHVATAKEDFDRQRREASAKEAAEKKETDEIPEIEEIEIDPVPVAKPPKKEKVKKAAPKKKEEKKEAEEDKEEESEEDNSPPPIGNGGEGPGYVWTQTLEEVEIRIEVPSNIRGKHLTVNLQNHKMVFGIKGQDPMVKGEWYAEIQDSLWTLETEHDKKFAVLSIEKLKGMCWWPCVIKGHPEINTKKISPENSKLEDLDGETRQTVEKMMFDQRQKAMGKPTSKEMSQQEKLKKFMAMHPEMDFSQAKFGGGMDGSMGNMFGGMN